MSQFPFSVRVPEIEITESRGPNRKPLKQFVVEILKFFKLTSHQGKVTLKSFHFDEKVGE